MGEKKSLRQNGAITVEAIISLTAFMFLIVTILSILNICIVQSRISVAINETAKELSQYSYLFSLTGIQESMGKNATSADQKKTKINKSIGKVTKVFSAIQNLGSGHDIDFEDMSGTIQNISNDVESIKSGGTGLYETFKDVASDPKGAAIGIAQIALVDGYNLAMSRLIAAPLAKGLCKKNLKGAKDASPDAYLKQLGVVPKANGSYYDALDFSESTIFPNGSSEIRVVVSYDVKIIALLPIDFTFHFKQSAVTCGWMGESVLSKVSKDSSKTKKKNSKGETFNIWTDATVKERTELIRHQGIAELCDAGGKKVTGASYQHINVYNPGSNTFYSVHSMNPLYSAEGESPKTLADVSDTAIKNSIEQMCAALKKEVSATTSVYTKKANGQKNTTPYNCEDASAVIVLMIPQDSGLKEKIQEIIDSSDTKGVTINLQVGYGNGARSAEADNDGGN